jgi:hypothetical protein
VTFNTKFFAFNIRNTARSACANITLRANKRIDPCGLRRDKLDAQTLRRRIASGCRVLKSLPLLGETMPTNLLSATQLRRRFREHVAAQLYDESGTPPEGLAIYALCDPRDLRHVRYVGQTSSPRRRFLQHLNHAQLWLPDDRPWWVKQPKLRPLYTWMRDLYRDDCRLPVMLVSAWTTTIAEARAAERARIFECLSQRLPLLNVETEILQGRVPLL